MQRIPGSHESAWRLCQTGPTRVNFRMLDKEKFAVISFSSRNGITASNVVGRGVDFGTLTHSETQAEEPKA